jgi:hypothetical protein
LHKAATPTFLLLLAWAHALGADYICSGREEVTEKEGERERGRLKGVV